MLEDSTVVTSTADFQIINNNENNEINKDYYNSLTISTEISNIDSKKINSILENHKNLKIL